ncbi:DUF3499 family protein [Kocuria sp. NPDC057446]|uniref:DUF3499 family protein n=1 Tax=Kocuria sp. NPDC057446 TaxID=3346137 RepID=UPI00367E7F23
MSSPGSPTRLCSRQTCTRDAVMTLTYVYSDSTAVVGPLAGHAEPHAYDLCAVHADRLTVPRGWRVVRLELPEARARREDIGAVAEAVRESPAPAPVRDRPRTVLRDVSLPPTPTPTQGSSGPPRPEGYRAGLRSGRRPDAVDSAERDRPVPDAEEPWHDVPVPASLERAHLRRPIAGGNGARPQI